MIQYARNMLIKIQLNHQNTGNNPLTHTSAILPPADLAESGLTDPALRVSDPGHLSRSHRKL